jgi:hypothetical protein
VEQKTNQKKQKAALSPEGQERLRVVVDDALTGRNTIALPDGAPSIGQRAAATRATGCISDAKSADKLAVKELKTHTIKVRVAPEFHLALKTYVKILNDEGRELSMASLLRWRAHMAMTKRLSHIQSLIPGAKGDRKKRLQADAKALGGYTVSDGG